MLFFSDGSTLQSPSLASWHVVVPRDGNDLSGSFLPLLQSSKVQFRAQLSAASPALSTTETLLFSSALCRCTSATGPLRRRGLSRSGQVRCLTGNRSPGSFLGCVQGCEAKRGRSFSRRLMPHFSDGSLRVDAPLIGDSARLIEHERENKEANCALRGSSFRFNHNFG